MQTVLGLFTALLALISNVYGQTSTSLLQKPDQPEILTTAQAMRMFYGNYDVRRHTSLTRMAKDKGILPGTGQEEMTVRLLFKSLIGELGRQRLFLLTYAVPRDEAAYECHACAPVIGMAVFHQYGQEWRIEASNQAVTFLGEWGKPPEDIQLVKIGANLMAVKIVDVGHGTGGETTSVLDLFIPWNGTVNLGLERVIADDGGGCEPGGVPCYDNRREFNLVRHQDAEYYDVELKLTGSDLPLNASGPYERARKVSGIEILRFDDGVYRQLSKEGDTTSIDEWMKQNRTND